MRHDTERPVARKGVYITPRKSGHCCGRGSGVVQAKHGRLLGGDGIAPVSIVHAGGVGATGD